MKKTKTSKISPTKVAKDIADTLYKEMREHEDLYPFGRITPALVHIKTFLVVRKTIKKAIKRR